MDVVKLTGRLMEGVIHRDYKSLQLDEEDAVVRSQFFTLHLNLSISSILFRP